MDRWKRMKLAASAKIKCSGCGRSTGRPYSRGYFKSNGRTWVREYRCPECYKKGKE